MRGRESAVEARHATEPPEHGRTPAQARRQYLQRAGGGLVAAFLGSITKPGEVRTRNGAPSLVFAAVPDGVREVDEATTTIRVEYLGDVEALAPRLVKGAAVYCEGRLTLSAWTGRDGAERTGLRIEATHVEVLGR